MTHAKRLVRPNQVESQRRTLYGEQDSVVSIDAHRGGEESAAEDYSPPVIDYIVIA
jgi:hypothetical protein